MADSDDFAALELELGKILAGLTPAARLKLSRSVAADLRRSQSARIAAQKDPDGSAFAPRKLREQRGRIKRKAAGPMFRKLRQSRWLSARATPDEAMAGFASATASRIARVHQLGLRDRVSREPKAPEATYPERRLLGFTAEEATMILDRAAAAVAGA